MKTTLSVSIALLTFLDIARAAPTETHGPQVLIEAKFIEVGDPAKDLLEPFGTAGESQTIAGPLNDAKLRTLWKKLEITEGVDVLSTPRVTVRSGQKGKIEIAREFAYKDAGGKPAKKQLGTMLTVLATKFEGNHFDLEVSPEIVELEGMVKVNSGGEKPKFNERGANFRTTMTMASGDTVVLGLPATSKKQITEERSAGHVTTKTENVNRHTMVFVTARLVDPADGKLVYPKLRN
jgi:Flp pilus assembly secretin CpaC